MSEQWQSHQEFRPRMPLSRRSAPAEPPLDARSIPRCRRALPSWRRGWRASPPSSSAAAEPTECADRDRHSASILVIMGGGRADYGQATNEGS